VTFSALLEIEMPDLRDTTQPAWEQQQLRKQLACLAVRSSAMSTTGSLRGALGEDSFSRKLTKACASDWSRPVADATSEGFSLTLDALDEDDLAHPPSSHEDIDVPSSKVCNELACLYFRF
jgi:hypothetical protein